MNDPPAIPTGCIYIITNIITGKQYVGQTTRKLNVRFSEHRKSQTYLGRAIRKYGVDAFTVEYTIIGWTQGELDTFEQCSILHHDTLTPNGYNISSGGPSWASEGGKKAWSDPDFRARKTQLTIDLWAAGKMIPPPHNSSDCRKGQAATIAIKRSKAIPIICHETGIIYECAADAIRSLDLSQSNLSYHLSGKARNGKHVRSVKGLTFSKMENK